MSSGSSSAREPGVLGFPSSAKISSAEKCATTNGAGRLAAGEAHAGAGERDG
eukprot:CAMPEP_0179933814 /NCGR_PEP_ID=MMETSP0983-20121128/12086_1 /TAXON_ID=483367 /ORGANISM="non described non described, Strain CCMP 2436" /LENGTH=51 /DNA_ID=CAMNT_0021838679 /DNA_START=748 /DNA_END=903 /DNA_ORIENTATION=-